MRLIVLGSEYVVEPSDVTQYCWYLTAQEMVSCYCYLSLLFLKKITFGKAHMSNFTSPYFEKGIRPMVSF